MELDLYAEELEGMLPELTAEELDGNVSLAEASTLSSFTSVSSFTCPTSTLGTFTTAATIG